LEKASEKSGAFQIASSLGARALSAAMSCASR